MNPRSDLLNAAPLEDTPRLDDHAGAELKRGAFFNTIALVVSNFRSIFTFLVARLLGPAILGVFSVAWATTDLFSKIGILGLDDAITTFIARSEAIGDRGRSRRLFRIATAVGLVQSIVSAVILIAIIRLFRGHLGLDPELVPALALLLCALPGIALYRISNGVSRGLKVMKHDIFSRGITESIATIAAFIFAFAIGFKELAPEIAAIIGTTASGIVALLLASRLFARVAESGVAVPLKKEIRELISYAFPISAYQFLNALVLRIDVIMLGWFVGRVPGVTLANVGVYGVALGLANGLRKINHAFNPIFAPVIAGLTATGDRTRAAATYARLAQWMLWLLLPTLAVIALAGDIILLLFGPAFRAGSSWLSITAVACAIEAYVGFGETIIMVQRPHLNLLNSSITCVIAVIANLWLIPRFGVTGAAFGILIPFLAQGILRYIALRFIFRWHNPLSNIAPPIIAAAIAILPALLCRTQLRGIPAQLASAAVFLVVFGLAWKYHRTRSMNG